MKDKIIYCYPDKSTFVLKDINLLSTVFDVLHNQYNWNNKILIPINLIKQFFYFTFNLKRTKGVIIMFAGFWSIIPVFLAKLYSKPSFIILGGTDCVSYPELNYGSLRKKGLKLAISYSVKNCTRLIPVAKELIQHENLYYDKGFKNQGLKSFVKELNTPFQEIANGYSLELKETRTKERVENSFISVALVNDETRYVLKGFDKIREIAIAFPNFHFTLVGVGDQILNKYFTKIVNVTCYGKLSTKEIDTLLNRSEFYLQLSISEGHPNALCEGMINGCIPIGSNVTSIPRIIGDSGFIINRRSSPELKELILSLSFLSKKSKLNLSDKARDRIYQNFSIDKREKSLLSLF